MFLAAVDGVVPLGAANRVAPAPPPPTLTRIVHAPPTTKLSIAGTGTDFAMRAPGVSIAEANAAKRGSVRIEDTLDLHGDTVDVARPKLEQFMYASHRLGRRCVLIIHGRGLHSATGATLRETVINDLAGPLSGWVHTATTARAQDGGDGATLVLLRYSK